MPKNSFPLMDAIVAQYKLDLCNGAHGVHHWERVWHIGNKLADKNGADKKVVSYFALLHDVCREDEGSDKSHGPRAGAFATLNRNLIDLDDKQFSKLIRAMDLHTGGMISKDVTVGTCWDADRLDLSRVLILPDKNYISTKEAKKDEFFNWASRLFQEKRKKVKTWV